jgi:hypothetical protein
MCKESALVGLHKRFGPKDSKWQPRAGKTRRDKEIGAWKNHLANKLSKAEENRR